MRVSKEVKYNNEREQLCNKVLTILNLKPDNSFTLYELDNDTQKQQQIMDLKLEFIKCFKLSKIVSSTAADTTKRDYLNIIRNILKQQGYTFVSNDYVLQLPTGEKKRTVRYYILRPVVAATTSS